MELDHQNIHAVSEDGICLARNALMLSLETWRLFLDISPATRREGLKSGLQNTTL